MVRSVLVWLAGVWDAIELWLTQLPFAFQFALVIIVLGPLCVGIAWAIDRAVDFASALVTRARDADPPLGGHPQSERAGR